MLLITSIYHKTTDISLSLKFTIGYRITSDGNNVTRTELCLQIDNDLYWL